MAKRWYVVHTYSQFEKSVQRALVERIARAGMQDLFGQILVPVEEVVELKSGQKSISERKFFRSEECAACTGGAHCARRHARPVRADSGAGRRSGGVEVRAEEHKRTQVFQIGRVCSVHWWSALRAPACKTCSGRFWCR